MFGPRPSRPLVGQRLAAPSESETLSGQRAGRPRSQSSKNIGRVIVIINVCPGPELQP